MEHFESQIESFQQRFGVTEECLDEVRRLCMAHAINCSMDISLLEQSSAWIVNKMMKAIEEEEAKLKATLQPFQ